jgi:hypothetical protein
MEASPVRDCEQHFDAIVQGATGLTRVRLTSDGTLYEARVRARSLDLCPLAIEHIVDGRTVARVGKL